MPHHGREDMVVGDGEGGWSHDVCSQEFESEQDVHLSHETPRPAADAPLPQKTPASESSTFLPKNTTQVQNKNLNTYVSLPNSYSQTVPIL